MYLFLYKLCKSWALISEQCNQIAIVGPFGVFLFKVQLTRLAVKALSKIQCEMSCIGRQMFDVSIFYNRDSPNERQVEIFETPFLRFG